MELSVFNDDYFMKQAFREAEAAYEENEVPVGAVVVCKNRIIAKARNQTERLNDVTAHAEMVAITSAANYLGSKYLSECDLYVTLEPCVMCAGALFWAQVRKVVFGAWDDKRGFTRVGKPLLHPKTKVVEGVMETECQQLLLHFFNNLRNS